MYLLKSSKKQAASRQKTNNEKNNSNNRVFFTCNLFIAALKVLKLLPFYGEVNLSKTKKAARWRLPMGPSGIWSLSHLVEIL
jgi:hypothetical protein